MSGPCLFLDADILFEPKSFQGFLDFAARHPLAIGVTAAKTDEAVFAVTRGTPDDLEILTFSREATPLEWANIVCARGTPSSVEAAQSSKRYRHDCRRRRRRS